MRLKRIAIIGLVIGLLLIALPVYAGMCKRGQILCRARAYPLGSRATVTATSTAVPYSETGVQNTPVAPPCDTSYPNSQIPGTCAHATAQSAVATWTAANCAAGEWRNGALDCLATVAPLWTATPWPYP